MCEFLAGCYPFELRSQDLGQKCILNTWRQRFFTNTNTPFFQGKYWNIIVNAFDISDINE